MDEGSDETPFELDSDDEVPEGFHALNAPPVKPSEEQTFQMDPDADIEMDMEMDLEPEAEVATEPEAAEPEETKAKNTKKAKKEKKAKKPKKGKKGAIASELAGAPEGPEGALPEGAPGEGDDHDKVGLKGHRFGTRLGRLSTGNFVAKLRSRLSKKHAEDREEEEAKQEEEAAIAEVIQPDERYKEVETYPIHPPYAFVRILFDDDMKEYIYQVLEPALTKTEKEILDFIEHTLVDNLTVSPEELEDADELDFITDRFNDVIFDYSIILHEDETEEAEIKKKLLYYIRRDFIGHGPIDVVMSDPFIEDISCDGPDTPVFLYHRKYESLRSTVVFPGHDTLDAYVIKMAQRSGKHISIAEPILDATMTDGSRLQATLGTEVSAGGSTFTVRKFRPDPFTPPDLVLFRTMSAEMLSYLWIAVQNGASCLYAGGTASGKTTSLNAILLFIPPQMKVISIEDTREVNLPHENWIAGITRNGFGPRDQFGRQAGEIDMFQLLKNALRQRPEYIIVGEVRGQEAYSLFQAMATGHAAYGTMHADSVDAVIHRLESDPINIPRSLLEALDVVSVQIQTRVGGKRVRRTKQISEIVGLDPHTREILTNEVFRWIPKDDSFKFSGVSYILERIQLEKGMAAGSMVKELKRRAEIINYMIEKKIQDYREVSKVVSTYYKEPEMVMQMIRGQLAPEDIPAGLREIANRAEPTEVGLVSAEALIAGKADLVPKAAASHKAVPIEAAHDWVGTEALLGAAEEHAAVAPSVAEDGSLAEPDALAAPGGSVPVEPAASEADLELEAEPATVSPAQPATEPGPVRPVAAPEPPAPDAEPEELQFEIEPDTEVTLHPEAARDAHIEAAPANADSLESAVDRLLGALPPGTPPSEAVAAAERLLAEAEADVRRARDDVQEARDTGDPDRVNEAEAWLHQAEDAARRARENAAALRTAAGGDGKA